jgi:hypothetical protein
LGRLRCAVRSTPPPPAIKSACVRGTEAKAAPGSSWLGHFFAWKPLILPAPLCFAWAGDVQRRGPLLKSFSSDSDTTQHAHDQKKAKRSGKGGLGGLPLLRRSISRGGFRGLPRRRQSNSHARRRRPCRAQWPGRTQLRRGVRGLPRLRHNTARPRAEES